MTESPGLPGWIVHPDGRREPFNSETIFQSLFRVLAHLGDADPFRARELADAVLHFLAESDAGESLTIDALHDTIVKVVRELGHIHLAKALSLSSPADAVQVREEMDHHPPEIAAAQSCGLLTFGDRGDSFLLAGSVLVPRPPGDMLNAIQEAGQHTATYVAIDNPEYVFAEAPSAAAIDAWIAELLEGLGRTGLRVVVNLNCRRPPAWAAMPGGGLFPPARRDSIAGPREQAADAILSGLAAAGGSRIRIDWHICDQDLQPEQRNRLLGVCRHIAEGVPIALVSDRTRRTIRLAEGLDREHPAVFGVVGLPLDQLADYIRKHDRDEDPHLLPAIPSLASLARSAGHARLRYLRAYGPPAVDRGFLLDRARLLVVPLGLRFALQLSTGHAADSPTPELNVIRAILGGLYRFPSIGPPLLLDSAPPGIEWSTGADEQIDYVPGWPPESRLRRAATIQGETETGTVAIHLPVDFALNEAKLSALIEYAYNLPGLCRFQLVACRPDSPTRVAG
jgi:hypothetical protein